MDSAMKNSILLVEDTKEIHRMVSQALSGPLVQLDWAETVADAEKLIRKVSGQLPADAGVETLVKLALS